MLFVTLVAQLIGATVITVAAMVTGWKLVANGGMYDMPPWAWFPRFAVGWGLLASGWMIPAIIIH